MDKKLDELLKADFIEEVLEGPSGWTIPIPTVEELLHDLNGSTVFSKVDLKWGFHQILLGEDSRHITRFVTHRGLHRYKRLKFDVCPREVPTDC